MNAQARGSHLSLFIDFFPRGMDDSICLSCYRTVTGRDKDDLVLRQRDHECSPVDLLNAGRGLKIVE